MEDDRLTRFVTELQDAFLEARWDDVLRHFAFPVVIYTVIGVRVLHKPQQLVQLTEQYLGALRAHDVMATVSEITEIHPPKNNRMRATVRFLGEGKNGEVVTTTVVRYFLVDQDGAYKIEMMEYLQEPFSPTVVEQIFH